jgi:glutathione S-transferase
MSEVQGDALTFYSAWFCPFAQRVWLALEEKKVAYTYVECELYEQDSSSKVSLSLEAKRALNPQFIECSPLGLVPALRDHNVHANVHDSLIALQYIDEAFPNPPGRRLMPADPVSRASVREAISHFEAKVRPQFYRLLMEPSEEGRAEAASALTTGLKGLGGMLWQRPFFSGEAFGAFECACLPWFQRIEIVLAHYRGYAMPAEGEEFDRLREWGEACAKRPCVVKTMVDADRLRGNYVGYANNQATSDCAQSVRRQTGGGK